uniref:GDNF family receptor alpha-4-like n=1 Tax=Jaculus jaculus TaxID=51337 RepID=UPI001E1B452D|nr:GDNF family receptor alpha-4-like [Jaculus jaculus]
MLFCSGQDIDCMEWQQQTIVPAYSYEEWMKPNCLTLQDSCKRDFICSSRKEMELTILLSHFLRTGIAGRREIYPIGTKQSDGDFLCSGCNIWPPELPEFSSSKAAKAACIGVWRGTEVPSPEGAQTGLEHWHPETGS